MKVFLFAFGRLKTPGMREAADHYLKMTRPWVSIKEMELKPLPVPGKNPEIKKLIQEKEEAALAEKIESHLPAKNKFYLLDERGKSLSTLDWARLIQDWETAGPAQTGLCLGSSMGFSERLKQKAYGTFALGPQTLSHELARVVLLEQLYRAWSLVRGHPYHNA